MVYDDTQPCIVVKERAKGERERERERERDGRGYHWGTQIRIDNREEGRKD